MQICLKVFFSYFYNEVLKLFFIRFRNELL